MAKSIYAKLKSESARKVKVKVSDNVSAIGIELIFSFMFTNTINVVVRNNF